MERRESRWVNLTPALAGRLYRMRRVSFYHSWLFYFYYPAWLAPRRYPLAALHPVESVPSPVEPVAGVRTASLQEGVRFEQAECMFSVPAGMKEGKDVECGWLTVPEQYENPDGPTIQLAVAILKSRAASPKPDPLVMAQGGPGGSTIDTYSQLIPLDPRLNNLDRDIVLFDQRGTLYSKPSLVCPEYLDMSIATLNENLTREQSDQKIQESLKLP